MSHGFEGVDDYQLPAAAWAWQSENPGRLIRVAFTFGFAVWWLGPEQLSDRCDICGAVSVSEEAVVANAVLAFRQDMDQEPSDEFPGCERRGSVSFGAIQAVVLHLEGDACRVEADQSAVGYCDAVGVTRQIGQYRLWPSEGFLGIHNPVDLAQRLHESTKDYSIGKLSMVAKEL